MYVTEKYLGEQILRCGQRPYEIIEIIANKELRSFPWTLNKWVRAMNVRWEENLEDNFCL